MLGALTGTPLVPHMGGLRLLGHVRASLQQATRTVSWKARGTAPRAQARGGSSSSRGAPSSRPSGGIWRDSSPARSGGSSSGNRGGSRSDSRGGGRGRGGSRGASPGQQQQQQRSWRESAGGNAADEDSWSESTYGADDDDGYGYGRDYSDDGDYRYPTRPSRASYQEQLDGEPLYGVAPILAALQAGSRTPHALLVQEGLSPQQRKDARALADIQRLARDKGAALRTVSKHELNMLSGNRPHQGLVLDASPLEWEFLEVLPTLEDLQEQQPQQQQDDESASGQEADRQQAYNRFPVWLALDEVMDPQNLGAMLRSAYCLGASGVLGCSRNCAPLSPVVSKASSGALELMTLYSCRSMPRTLADAASKGWAVVGAAAEEGATPVSQLKVDRPTVLVMGNEGYGLRPTVKRCCTQLVQIEMDPPGSSNSSRRQQLVDSLNVSVATGILLHQLLTTARQQ